MLYLCFSAYNEAENLPLLLRRIASHLAGEPEYEVVAFDDGSTDQTRSVLHELSQTYPLTVLGSDKNLGLGGGMMQLVRYICAQASANDIAIFMDADDTHDPEAIAPMCSAIAHGAHVVIASRFVAGSTHSGIPLYRQCLSNAASAFWRVMLPIENVRDYSCGYRAYRVSMLQRAYRKYGEKLITRSGFECQVELLQRLVAVGARCAEVPIRLCYERKKGDSKMRVVRTIRRSMSLAFCLLSRSAQAKKQM